MINQKQKAIERINKALYDYENNVEDYGLIIGLIFMAYEVEVITETERNNYFNKLNVLRRIKKNRK